MSLFSTKKLVILPGLGCGNEFWTEQAQILESQMDVSIYAQWDTSNLDSVVDKILSDAPDNFTLVGHSLGGWLAQYIASIAPDRVNSMILLSSLVSAPSQDIIDILKNILSHLESDKIEELLPDIVKITISNTHENKEALIEKALNWHLSFSKETYINQVKAEIKGSERPLLLDKITCPTLVLHGKEDPFFSKEEQELLAAKIPQSKFVTLSNCAHMAQIERPKEVSNWILEMVNQKDS